MLSWNNAKLKITAGFIPRFFWTTASIDVYVGDNCVLKTGGPFRRTGANVARFCHNRGIHDIRLEWGKADWRWFPYKLIIDDAVVVDSKVYIRNWPLLAVPYAAFMLASILLPHFLLTLPFMKHF